MERAEDIVKRAESVYQRRSLEEAMDFYYPDAVIVWNGREVARGAEQVRSFHEKFFDPAIKELSLKKTLRAASGDTIAVEWHATWENPDGSHGDQTAAEFWTLKEGRLTEWRAFVNTRRVQTR